MWGAPSCRVVRWVSGEPPNHRTTELASCVACVACVSWAAWPRRVCVCVCVCVTLALFGHLPSFLPTYRPTYVPSWLATCMHGSRHACPILLGWVSPCLRFSFRRPVGRTTTTSPRLARRLPSTRDSLGTTTSTSHCTATSTPTPMLMLLPIANADADHADSDADTTRTTHNTACGASINSRASTTAPAQLPSKQHGALMETVARSEPKRQRLWGRFRHCREARVGLCRSTR